MAQILTCIGNQRPVWEDQVRYLRENFGAKDKLKFYGKKLGWAIRFLGVILFANGIAEKLSG